MTFSIPETKEELEKEFMSVSRQLETIGLSQYESRAYIALVALGHGTAETVAKTARIPRTSAYSVLKSLETKGFSIAVSDRPVMYKPEPPVSIHQRIIKEMDETFAKLELLHEIIVERGVPQLIYTILGNEKVKAKIIELIDKSVKQITISTPKLSATGVSKKLQEAAKRGIDVTIITGPSTKVPEGCNIYRRTGLIATDVIGDGERALIASADLSACGYIENASLAEHLQSFLQIMMREKQ